MNPDVLRSGEVAPILPTPIMESPNGRAAALPKGVARFGEAGWSHRDYTVATLVTGTVTMHLKFRRNQALLYRSAWVPRGAEGNTHGFTRQVYVGSIAQDAASVPAELRERLTEDEVEFVEGKVCRPTRDRIAAQASEAELRQRDPAWRVAEAARLVEEAVERSAEQPVTVAAVTQLREKVERLRVGGDQAKPRGGSSTDPLADAVLAVRAAAQAVVSGRYGKAPAKDVRGTRPYKLWAQLLEAVQGEGGGSLLRALQDKGYVKRRGG